MDEGRERVRPLRGLSEPRLQAVTCDSARGDHTGASCPAGLHLQIGMWMKAHPLAHVLAD